MRKIVEIEEDLIELKFKFENWIFVLDKLKHEWSAVKRNLIEG